MNKIKYFIREFLLKAVFICWIAVPACLKVKIKNFFRTFYHRHRYSLIRSCATLQAKYRAPGFRAVLLRRPLVSIIIPSFNNSSCLKECLEAVKKNTHYDNYEVILADNNTFDKDSLRIIGDSGHKVVKYSYKFNFSRINNLAAKAAAGEFLVFLNNDTIPQKDWLSPLLAECLKSDVGIAGSRLLYKNNTIQHAGMDFDKKLLVFFHPYRGEPHGLREANYIREVPAVTGACLMIRKSLFDKVGGFDEEYWAESQDVDLCFKARGEGLKVIYTPSSVLYHDEGTTRGLITEDARVYDSTRLRRRWIDNGLIYNTKDSTVTAPHKILLIKLLSMGDVIMVTPVIEAVKKKYPRSELVFATSCQYKDIVDDNPYIDRLVLLRDFDRAQFDSELDYYRSMTLALLYQERWDLVYQLQLLDMPCGYWGTDHHLRDLYAEMANVRLVDEKPVIPVAESQRAKIASLLERYVKDGEKIILLHSTSGWKLKDWDRAKFPLLIEMIKRKYNSVFFQVGGPNDALICDDRVINLLGRLTLKEVAALMERSGLLICPDTGLMHMASAVGLKVVALFGPTSPPTGGPVSGDGYFCLQSDSCCDVPCHMKECSFGRDCAKDISVDKVFEAVCGIIDLEPGKPRSVWKGCVYDGLGREVFNNRSGTGGFRF